MEEDAIVIFQPESLLVKSSLWVHAIAGKLNKVHRRDDEFEIFDDGNTSLAEDIKSPEPYLSRL